MAPYFVSSKMRTFCWCQAPLAQRAPRDGVLGWSLSIGGADGHLAQ